MSDLPNIKSLEQQAAAAVESGDPADAARFAQETGLQPNVFQVLLEANGAELMAKTVLAYQREINMPEGGPISGERMAQAIERLFQHDLETRLDRVGNIVIARSDDPAHKTALYRAGSAGMACRYYDQESDPALSGMTVFFKDRIPSGIEDRVIFREMYQLNASRVDTSARQFLLDAMDRWETFGASANSKAEAVQTREIYEAVERRIEDFRKRERPLPSSVEETRFAFAIQAAVERGVVPDPKGQAISGWMHEVAEHVKYTIKHTMGVDLGEMSGKQVLEMTSLYSPFTSQIDNMKRIERGQLYKEAEALAKVVAADRNSRLLVSSVPEMEVGLEGWPVSRKVLGFYEDDEPVIVVFDRPDDDCPDAVRIRTADSEGWDVTERIVAWVEVPMRRDLDAEQTNDSAGVLNLGEILANRAAGDRVNPIEAARRRAEEAGGHALSNFKKVEEFLGFCKKELTRQIVSGVSPEKVHVKVGFPESSQGEQNVFSGGSDMLARKDLNGVKPLWDDFNKWAKDSGLNVKLVENCYSGDRYSWSEVRVSPSNSQSLDLELWLAGRPNYAHRNKDDSPSPGM